MYYIFGYDEERPEGTKSHGYGEKVNTLNEIEDVRKKLESKTGAKIYMRVLALRDDEEIPNEYLTDKHIGRSSIKPSGGFKINVEQLKIKANESNNS